MGRGIRLLGWLVRSGENANFNLQLQIILLKPLRRPPVLISSEAEEEDRNILPAYKTIASCGSSSPETGLDMGAADD